MYSRQKVLIKLFLLSFSLSSMAFASSSNDNNSIDLRFSILITAESSGSLEAMVVDGGSWFTKRKLVHTAVLVSHPKGDFLFDSGIGREYEEQMSIFSFFEKQLFKIENVAPAKEQLTAADYNFSKLFAIIPSHMHWDHASGLEDFAGVPIWIQKDSYQEAIAGEPPGFILSQYDDKELKWHNFELNEKHFEGFSKSVDIFNDGSVVLVDLSGHTHGQVGMFITLKSGKRYFFIGDTTWSKLGVEKNKPRPGFVDWLVGVDTDFHKNSLMIEKIHQLSLTEPELVIVPAHDELVVNTLPVYPEFSN